MMLARIIIIHPTKKKKAPGLELQVVLGGAFKGPRFWLAYKDNGRHSVEVRRAYAKPGPLGQACGTHKQCISNKSPKVTKGSPGR